MTTTKKNVEIVHKRLENEFLFSLSTIQKMNNKFVSKMNTFSITVQFCCATHDKKETQFKHTKKLERKIHIQNGKIKTNLNKNVKLAKKHACHKLKKY